MKTWFRSFAYLSLLLAFTACEKDEVRVVVKPGAAPALSASVTSVVLDSASAALDAVKFTWTEPDYGYDAGITYTLMVDKKGNNFVSAISLVQGISKEKTFKEGELNDLALLLGLAPGAPGQLEIQVKSDISPSIDALTSGVFTLTVTPYLVVINYPSLFVPGNYQGWAPDQARKIVSVRGDQKYEGFVNLADPSPEFKFTDAPNWNNKIYGDVGDGTTGNIDPAGNGNNMKVSGPGYYRLKADITAFTWEAVKTSWGLIGSATPNGWDADQDMTYDVGTDSWTITLNLVAGEIKFRANDGWDINFGDDGANGLLEYGGANIAVGEAGNYTVTLNLGVGGNYNYVVKKN
ncbi:MAG: SusE domain-containing protein [Bacteroidia bacterium]|nr:SusE domain-containing protein [Bacteroidia bacterium]